MATSEVSAHSGCWLPWHWRRLGIGIGRCFGNEKGSGPHLERFCVCLGSAIDLVGSREWVAGFRSVKASQLKGGHTVREGLEKCYLKSSCYFLSILDELKSLSLLADKQISL